jgi:hypothetical protein
MHSVSKLYETKGQLEWEAFNAGNDVLCFAENVPRELLPYSKEHISTERVKSYNRIHKKAKESRLTHCKTRGKKILF